MKHADISLEVLPEFIEKIKVISKDYGIDFVVSVSAELEEMIGVNFDECEVLNYRRTVVIRWFTTSNRIAET